MKKLLFIFIFVLCISAEALKANNFNLINLTTTSIMSNEDMKPVAQTTAFHHNGLSWQSHTAAVFRNMEDGTYWIKISIFANGGWAKCRVVTNPDYTGGIKNGKRSSCKYMANDGNYTYYFNF